MAKEMEFKYSKWDFKKPEIKVFDGAQN